MKFSPFNNEDEWLTDYLIFQNIKKLNYKIDTNKIPEDAIDLIQSLLIRDPQKRLGAEGRFEQLKKHSYFNKIDFNKIHT